MPSIETGSSPAAHSTEHLQPSTPSKAYGSIYATIARLGFGLDVSGPPDLALEADDTTRAISAMDIILDRDNDGALHEKVLCAIADNRTDLLPPVLVKYANNFANWGRDKQEAHLDSHRTIRETAQQKRSTTSVDDLCDILVTEGCATGQLYHVYDSRESAQAFGRVLELCGIGALVVDTLFDLKKDFDNGISEVLPTLRNRQQIARLGQLTAKEAWRTVPRKSIWTGVGITISSALASAQVALMKDRDIHAPQVFDDEIREKLEAAYITPYN